MHEKPKYQPRFTRFPPHIAREPETLAWSLDHTQTTVEEHEQRLATLEARPHLPELIVERIPWLKLAGVIGSGILFAAGLLSREEAKTMAKGILGVLFGF